MNKIGVVTNKNKDDIQLFKDLIIDKLGEIKVDLWQEDQVSYDPVGTDLLIVLGGDGTMLKAFHNYIEMGIPFLGVNFGNVGFLSSIEPDEFFRYFDSLIKREYFLEERNAAQVSLYQEKEGIIYTDYAFNDVVIRSFMPKISKQMIKIDDHSFSEYQGDGIICATSTGSTAYSLSAGASMVDPSLAAFIITPICSRANIINSIVISEEHTIEITCDDPFPCSILSIDGNDLVRLFPHDQIKISKSPLKIKLVQFEQGRYFTLLQSKLFRGR